MTTLLVFGATGTIGTPVMNRLMETNIRETRIKIFTSSKSASTEPKASLLAGWKQKGAEIITGDINDESAVNKAYEGTTMVLSMLGRTAIQQQILLIRLASEHPSITNFIPSEVGTDIKHNAKSAHEKPHQAKLAVRAALEKTKLDYVYLVTGPFSDTFVCKSANDAYGTFDSENKKMVLLGTGQEKIAFTSMKDVALYMSSVVKILQAHPAGQSPISRRAIKVHSFVTTLNAIAEEFKRQVDERTEGSVDDWNVNYVSLSALEDLEDRMWKEQNPLATVATLRRIWLSGGTLYERWNEDLLDVMQQDLDTVEDVVKKAINR